MSTILFTADFRKALESITERLSRAENELNVLDAALGDGDCGSTVAALARAVRREIRMLPDDLGDALVLLARVFIRNSASSFSGLMMIGLIRAAGTLKGRTEVEVHELSELIRDSIDAMSERGGARLGDKSVLDGFAAVADALGSWAGKDQGLAVRVDRAVAETLDRFREKPSGAGKARLMGRRSIGLDDPGMMAVKMMTESLCTTGASLE